MGWPEGPKIGRVPISAMLHTPLQGISISMKNKKVMPVESYVMPKNQKSWLPPPLALNVRIFQVCPEMFHIFIVKTTLILFVYHKTTSHRRWGLAKRPEGTGLQQSATLKPNRQQCSLTTEGPSVRLHKKQRTQAMSNGPPT